MTKNHKEINQIHLQEQANKDQTNCRIHKKLK